MPWLKKSSGEEPTGASSEAPVDPVAQVDPVLEPLTTAEVDWVRSSIAELGDRLIVELILGDHRDRLGHVDQRGWRLGAGRTVVGRIAVTLADDDDSIGQVVSRCGIFGKSGGSSTSGASVTRSKPRSRRTGWDRLATGSWR